VDITIIRGPNQVATLMIYQYGTMQAAKAVAGDSQFVLLVCHVPTESARGVISRGSTASCITCGVTTRVPLGTRHIVYTHSGRGVGSIVVAESSGLHDLQWQAKVELDVFACDDWSHN
jgi:hypothetical protein